MHFLTLPQDDQIEAIEAMSRMELIEILKLSLPGTVQGVAYERLYEDLPCGDDIYRWHNGGGGKKVIKLRTYGKDGNSYGGWSFYKTFNADQLKDAQACWGQLCFQAENPELPVVVEGEMMPAGSQITTRLQLQPWLQSAVDELGTLHQQAKCMAQISILLAAKAGAMLNEAKARCEHGEWMQFMKALPFSTETTRRYRNLAEEFSQRLVGPEAIDLLQLPGPAELSKPQYEQTISSVRAVTGEKTLGQLYFDWNILKQAGKPGGHNPGTELELPEGENLTHYDAVMAVGRMLKELDTACLSERRCIVHLRPTELQRLEGELVGALHNVRDLIKAG